MIEEHKQMIDNYFSNGFNGSKALQDLRPELGYNTAKVTANSILKSKSNQEYIQGKRQELRARANIETEQITTELINWIYSDATDYIGLNVKDLKGLPNELKRCIQSVKHRVKEYKDRAGQDIREEVLEVRIIDKSKAVEILNKMLGNYSLDNSQKGTKVNIETLNVQELKLLANILTKTG
jgi:phage terminase small subunit